MRQLGSEGPPTVSNEGDLCERCGKAARDEKEANQARLQVAATREKAKPRRAGWVYRIRQKEAELAAGVAIKRGAFWKAVRGVRERWQIEAQTQVPRPISPGAYYVPAQLAHEPQRDDAGYEVWADRLSEWDGELLTLYKTFIPEDCRESVGPDALNWLAFLSAIVLYDPPIADRPDIPGLPEFCNAFSGSPRVGLRLMARDGSTVPDPEMALGPFSLVQDAREVEEMLRERDLLLITGLQKRGYIQPGCDPEEVREDVLCNTPGLAEELGALIEQKAPQRIVADHEKSYSNKEARDALSALLKARPESPKGGRNKERDPALAAEAAILASRPGWSHQRVAEFHGWMRGYDYSLATQWIADGKEIITKL